MTRRNRKRHDARLQRARLRKLAAALLAPVLSMSGLMAGAWWLNDALRVQQWHVRGDAAVRPMSEAALQRMLAGHNDLWHTWPSRLRASLLAELPDLADAQVSRRLDGVLEVRVVARKPVVLWWRDDAVWLVDAEGHAYRPLRKGEWPDLPLLRMPEERLVRAIALLAQIQRAMPGRLARISEVHAEAEGWKIIMSRGEMWLLPEQGAARRLRRLAEVLSRPRWRQRHFRVDARDDRRWYLRLAKQQGVI